MPVSETSCRVEHDGNGSATEFAFTFPIVDTSDLIVIHKVKSTGAETVLKEGDDYSVSAPNNDFSSGGTVTTAKYESTVKLILLRDTPNTQAETLITDTGTLRLKSLVDAVDKLTLLIQQLQEEVNRCLKFPRGDISSLSSEISNSVDRANGTLGFDSNGEPTIT